MNTSLNERQQLELNKTYTWDAIEAAYPNKWAVITDIKKKDGEIKTCKLLAICTKDQKSSYIKKYLGTNIKFECRRTTFSAPNVGTLLW